MYEVVLRQNSTGTCVTIQMDYDWDDTAKYLWELGNYSCDCNRALFFYGFKGAEDRECGHSEYTALKAILPDGTEKEIYDY